VNGSELNSTTAPAEGLPANPLAIYQKVIDLLSYATLHGDTEIIRTHIRVPFTMTTETAEFVYDDEDEMVASCLVYTDTLRSMGVTDYIRIARDAQTIGSDHIEGVHYTHTIRRAERVMLPYPSRMVIERKDGVWAVTHAYHAISNDRAPIFMPQPAPDAENLPPLHYAAKDTA
jgi:hypothetical protein